jgi:hypothetical protein
MDLENSVLRFGDFLMAAAMAACASTTGPADFAIRTQVSETPLAISEGFPTFLINAIVTNNGGSPLFIDHCGPTVEKREGELWNMIDAPVCVGANPPQVVPPADSAIFPVVVRDSPARQVLFKGERPITPGVYRLVFLVGDRVARTGFGIENGRKVPSTSFVVTARE